MRRCLHDRPAGRPVDDLRRARRPTATEPAEHRGLRRDQVRLLVADPGRHHPHHRSASCPSTCDRGDLLVVNTSGHVAGRVRRPVARRPTRRGAPGDRPAGRHLGRRTAHRTGRGRSPCWTPRRASGSGCPAGVRLRLVTPYPRPDPAPPGRGNRLWRVRDHRDRVRDRLPVPARPADRLRLPARPVPAGRLPDGVRQPIPAAPRCPAPAGPSPATGGPAGRRRRRRRTDHAAHRRLLAGCRRGAAGRVVRGAGADRGPGQLDPTVRRPGRSRSAPR